LIFAIKGETILNTHPSNTVFAFSSLGGYEVQTLMLLRSLREFGGELAQMPVWIFVPDGKPLKPDANAQIGHLDAEIHLYSIEESLSQFPFAYKTIGAAHAEQLAESRHVNLAWHDRTGFICNQPTAFLLPADKAIAFRPTDIANIGAPYGEPLMPFWQTICDHFDINPEHFPPITTVLDQRQLYLYVNAGLLIVRPEYQVLRTWAQHLVATYALPKFQPFYRHNSAYAIFMHQTALTIAVVQRTNPTERLILPDSYLFSVDNFFDYPEHIRPNRLDDIATGRFHDFFALADWEEKIIASEQLVDWFKSQLQAGPYWPSSG
jgi:hypothetical protein